MNHLHYINCAKIDVSLNWISL